MANAGDDQIVESGATVTLDGTASTDANDTIVAYRWTQIDGPVVTLADGQSATTTFAAPIVPHPGATLAFALEVEDQYGDKDTDEVEVFVNWFNTAPQLEEIADQSVMILQSITFTAVATDGENQAISLTAQPLPQGANFQDHGDGTGTFTWVPDIGQEGNYAITVTASDGSLTDEEIVQINVSDNPSIYTNTWTHIPTSITSTWQTITLTSPYAAPVVMAGLATENEQEPGVVSIRNVTRNSVEVSFQEWNYLDGNHGLEMTSLLILPTGRYVLPDSTVIEAGNINLASSHSHSFQTPFADSPQLFLTLQTQNGASRLTARAITVTDQGFTAQLQSEEALSSVTTQTLGYLAIYSASGSFSTTVNGSLENLLLENLTLDSTWVKAPAGVYHLEEEQSQDQETAHIFEDVSILKFGNSLWAQVSSNNESDPCVIRQSLNDDDTDGLFDQWERQYFDDLTQTAQSDPEGDGLTNIQEWNLGTNPASTDSDNDGMPDGWEVSYGLDPLADDSSGDEDLDGLSNLEEFEGGYDPTVPAPTVTTVNAAPSSGVVPLAVEFTSAASGQITTFSWTFGDGGAVNGQTANHTYDLPGEYVATVTVIGVGGFATGATSVSVTNGAPQADAGPDQTVLGGATVTLNGLNSSDPNDVIVSYQWQQTEGPAVVLSHTNSPTTSFVAPAVPYPGVGLTFKLTVTDSYGLQDEDTINVNVTWTNEPPQANAGQDQLVNWGQLVTLDGTGSTDPDDGIASFNWQQVEGTPIVSLSDPESATPSFTFPAQQSEDLALTFELTVTDNGGLFSSDRVTINAAAAGLPPVADAGVDQQVDEGTTVVLDASNSQDPENGDLNFLWQQLEGGSVVLSDTTTDKPTFVPPSIKRGTIALRFQVTVTDETNLSNSDEVVIIVSDNGIRKFNKNYIPFFASTGDPLGVRPRNNSALVELYPKDPDTISDNDGRPGEIPYGMIATKLKVPWPGAGAKLVFHLPQKAERGYGWFMWDEANGWKSCRSFVDVSGNFKKVTLDLVDGGRGDSDGKVDGFISTCSGMGSGCFIATAAYGSPFEPKVKVLRRFRDECLAQTPLGQWFIGLYYEHSPKMAGFISRSSMAKMITQICLLPAIAFAWTALTIGTIPALVLLLLLLLAIPIGYRKYVRAVRT